VVGESLSPFAFDGHGFWLGVGLDLGVEVGVEIGVDVGVDLGVAVELGRGDAPGVGGVPGLPVGEVFRTGVGDASATPETTRNGACLWQELFQQIFTM
jgi:hypothetical protein